MQSTDEVIQEVRRIKEALAEALDFDIDRIVLEAQQNQQASGREYMPPPDCKSEIPTSEI
jgi:hypothetical protein